MSNNPSIDRAQFLRGDWKGDHSPLRPPWALAEGRFRDLCDGCGDCIDTCSEKILLLGRGRYPEVDFTRGECTFCGDCVAACPTAALRVLEDAPPWTLRARIEDHCIAYHGVECRSCGEYCEQRAIPFRLQAGAVARPELNPAECNGCGACIKPCPVQAITIHPSQPAADAPAVEIVT